jgi:uncharacterized membrane protein YgcG
LGGEWWAGVVAEGLAAYESHVDGSSSRPRDAVLVAGRAPGHADWFETHGDFLSTFWPSPLEQQLCVAPRRARTAWGRGFSAGPADAEEGPHRGGGVCTPAAPPALPRINSRGGVAMPQRTYWSFSREARVLKKLLAGPPTGLPDDAAASPLAAPGSGIQGLGGDAMKWALCFEDSTYHGDFTSTLHDALHRLPSVDSLSFRAGYQPQLHAHSSATGSNGGGSGGSSGGSSGSGRSFDGGVSNRAGAVAADSNTTCLAHLAQDLPLSVRHVTYDGVLSRDAVQILGVALMSRTVHQVQNANRPFLCICDLKTV